MSSHRRLRRISELAFGFAKADGCEPATLQQTNRSGWYQ